MPGPSHHVQFSLTRGGLLYQLLRWLRVIRHDANDLRRQVGAWVGVTWGVLIILLAVDSVRAMAPVPLLGNPSVHVRFLLAIPLLVVAEATLEARCLAAAADVAAERIPADPGRWEAILRRAGRLRDAWWPELLFLAGVVVAAQLAWWGGLGAPPGDRTPAHAWHRLAALPLFQFLLVRVVWQWLRWAHVLWRLARQPLQLTATHPDRVGGLGHLELPVAGLVVAILAGSAVVSSGWGARIMEGEVTLPELMGPLLILAVFLQLLALGPLLVFAPHLFRLRANGIRTYGIFAMHYTTAFHERWIAPRTKTDEEPLGSQDIQALADLGTAFAVVESVRFAPFGRRAVYLVLGATLLPMAPLVFTEMSLADVIRTVGGALVGGPAMEAGEP